MKKETHTNYRDHYFERGYWKLKIWETLVILLCWLIMFVPGIITGLTYLAYRTNGRYGHYFWHYREGFQELNFLFIFLGFAFGISAVFCLTTAFIQNQRRHGLSEKWPMFEFSRSKIHRENAEQFMTKRFADQESRQNVSYYQVKAAQNLGKHQLKAVVEGKIEEEKQ